MAKGFWLWEPIPVDIAAGANPTAATRAAIKTAFNFADAAWQIASVEAMASRDIMLFIDETIITAF